VNKDYVLIVTNGQTGSTLLQGVLNSIEGWHIKGENMNFVYHLYKAHEALSRARLEREEPAIAPTLPWYGIDQVNLEGVEMDIRRVVENVLLSGQNPENLSTVGFKEIRYFDIFTLGGVSKGDAPGSGGLYSRNTWISCQRYCHPASWSS